MRTKSISCKRLTIFFLIVGLVMYLLNLYTPMFCDDWHYVYVWGTHERVHDLMDVLRSQYYHYFDHNGRSFTNGITQVFDGILGKSFFNICNAVVFLLFLYMITLVTSKEKKHYYKIVSVSFILIFFIMTGFKHVFLWLNGSFNYLWAGTLILFFMHLINVLENKISNGFNIPLFLVGFVAGWSHEGLVVPLFTGLFFYYIFHKKELNKQRAILLLGGLIGSMFLVFSPGSIGRFFSNNQEMPNLLSRLYGMHNVGLFYLFLIGIVIKYITERKTFLQWIKKEQVLIIALIVAFLFVASTSVIAKHSRFGIELFSLLLVLRMINWERVSNQVVSIANVLTLAFAGFVVFNCHKCYEANSEELAQIKGSNTIVKTTQPIKYSFLHRYALDYSGFETTGEEKLYGESIWLNMYYYNYDNVIFMPKEFINDLENNFDSYNSIKTFGNLPFYAKRIPLDKEYSCAIHHYDEPSYSFMPQFLWPLCRKIKGETYTEGSSVMSVVINGYKYLLIPRGLPKQTKKLRYITLQ